MKEVNDNSEKQLPALTAEDAARYGERTGQGIRKRDPEKY